MGERKIVKRIIIELKENLPEDKERKILKLNLDKLTKIEKWLDKMGFMAYINDVDENTGYYITYENIKKIRIE